MRTVIYCVAYYLFKRKPLCFYPMFSEKWLWTLLQREYTDTFNSYSMLSTYNIVDTLASFHTPDPSSRVQLLHCNYSLERVYRRRPRHAFDSKLHFVEHIENIVKKLSMCSTLLPETVVYYETYLLPLLSTSTLARSQLEYCIPYGLHFTVSIKTL